MNDVKKELLHWWLFWIGGTNITIGNQQEGYNDSGNHKGYRTNKPQHNGSTKKDAPDAEGKSISSLEESNSPQVTNIYIASIFYGLLNTFMRYTNENTKSVHLP